MELKTVKYNAEEIKPHSVARRKFENETSDSNIIYLFYNKTTCLYIGETDTSLYKRCYEHTPKESEQPWFKEGDTIHIIKLDDSIDRIGRGGLESCFILVHRPKYNKKC